MPSLPNTCVACTRKVTNHSAKNSIILASSFGRIFWTVWSADSMSGTCVGGGSPTVRLARGHGSGSVDRQCSNSEVSSGNITGKRASLGSIIYRCPCCALAHLCVNAGRLVHCLAFVGSSLCLVLPPLPRDRSRVAPWPSYSRWCLSLGIWLQL